MSENKEDLKQLLESLRRYRIVDINMTRCFIAVLFAVAVLALIPALRTDYSDTERRELTKFPEFTWSALVSGEYFDQIGLWFSDTFPFRDRLITLNGYITNAFGGRVSIHGDLTTGDDIPDVAEPDTEDQTQEVNSSSEPVESETPSSVPENNASVSTPTTPTPPQTPQTTQTPTGPIVEQLGAVLVVNDTAYEYYNFIKNTADQYVEVINRAAALLPGVQVYDMVVPTSIAITAPQDIVAGVNTSDQKKAIDYMYSILSPNVQAVRVFDTLMAHRSEYIYFRTDHHWTARGAYYAYCELMNLKGIAPMPLSGYTELQFPGFLGSFYSSTGKNPRLAANPDTVFAYLPQINMMTEFTTSGKKDVQIVRDGNALGQSNKYLSFLGGDKPLGLIVNEAMAGGPVCTVIKDSFGNCFVPLLVEHYFAVYIVDYRHISTVDGRKLQQFVAETGTTEVLFINNISSTRNSTLVGQLAGFVG